MENPLKFNLTGATRNSLQAQLAQFYAKPITGISFELFLSIGLVAVLALFALKPTFITIAELNTQIEEKTQLLAQLNEKQASLLKASQLLQQNQDSLQLVDQVLPATAEVVKTAKIIEKLATENNVVITTMGISNIPDEIERSDTTLSTQSPTPVSLPIGLQVKGKYADIKQFIAGLQNSQRMFSVESINFTIDNNRGTKSLQIAISLNAPHYGVSP